MLNDNVLFLKHSLNAAALASLKGQAMQLEGQVDALIRDMRVAIDEADGTIEIQFFDGTIDEVDAEQLQRDEHRQREDDHGDEVAEHAGHGVVDALAGDLTGEHRDDQ